MARSDHVGAHSATKSVEDGEMRKVAPNTRGLGESVGDTDELARAVASGDNGKVLQCVETYGPRLLAAGRLHKLRDAIALIPLEQRTGGCRVLDAMAALAMDQLEIDPSHWVRIDEPLLDELDSATDLSRDDRIALGGLRCEFFRHRGDPRMAKAAIETLAMLPPITSSTEPTEIVRGLNAKARRGVFYALYALGVASLYSGDAPTLREGLRLCNLAFVVATRAGIDPVVPRGQSAYERLLLGLEFPQPVSAALEASSSALRMARHPEAANHYVQLADTIRKLGDFDGARAALVEAGQCASDFNNALVVSSIEFLSRAIDCEQYGPTDQRDADLVAAWQGLIASPRLRRAAASFAARVANVMLDHDAYERADRWLERGRAVLDDRIQTGYQRALIALVEKRGAFLRGAPSAQGYSDATKIAVPNVESPAGSWEFMVTRAWDRLRRGDRSEAQRLLRDTASDLGPLWNARLRAGAPQNTTAEVDFVLFAASLTVRRGDAPDLYPTGHAARLLTWLVLRGGSATTDAVCELLWPATDADVARNRLHQLLLRIRRLIDCGESSIVTVVDGAVMLRPDGVTSDVWRMRSASTLDVDICIAIVNEYSAPMCSVQAAYDDALADDRMALSHRLADIVERLLLAPGLRHPGLRHAVEAAWIRLPDEDRIGLAYAVALERLGESARARQVRDHVEARLIVDW